MPNHFHLLIEVNNAPLSAIMQRLLTGYTRYHNRRHKKWGHLFQGRYKAIICEKDSYLLDLTRYIHLNPVRANLVTDSGAWRWSGHHALAGSAIDGLIGADSILLRFSDNKNRAHAGYRAFELEGCSQGHRGDLYPAEKQPYVGNDAFIIDHQERHETIVHAPKNVIIPLSAILSEAARRHNVGEALITGYPAKLMWRMRARHSFWKDMRQAIDRLTSPALLAEANPLCLA